MNPDEDQPQYVTLKTGRTSEIEREAEAEAEAYFARLAARQRAAVMRESKMSIEWSTWSWNPVIGCSPVSPGCAHCYAAITAYGLANRFKNADYAGLVKGGPQHALWTGQVKTLPQRLAEPLHKKRPQVIFVNSMGDLFHPLVPREFIAAVFGVMAAAPQHEFVILTKHIERAEEFMAWVAEDCKGRFIPAALAHHAACIAGFCHVSGQGHGDYVQRAWNKLPARRYEQWPLPNVHMGPSVENQTMADKRLPVAVRLARLGWKIVVSAEPLLGPLDLTQSPLHHISWLIAGGESTDSARVTHLPHLEALRDQCAGQGVPCYIKQLGARVIEATAAEQVVHPAPPMAAGRRGEDIELWPHGLRVFQAPPRIAAILNAQKNPPRVVAALEPAASGQK